MCADRVYNVLFLCTGNSARSILAEALLERLGRGRFRAYSAGSLPKGEVNPYALQRLAVEHYDVSRFRSKDWSEFTRPGSPEFDFVITLCDKAAMEPCPVWPGQPMTAHWGLPDPAAVEGREAEKHAAFAETMRMLAARIGIFVNLPLTTLDRLSLRRRLDAIGGSGEREGSAA
jgi:protein-tyrosine-phosphatase